jgi:hypothetical protein
MTRGDNDVYKANLKDGESNTRTDVPASLEIRKIDGIWQPSADDPEVSSALINCIKSDD